MWLFSKEINMVLNPYLGHCVYNLNQNQTKKNPCQIYLASMTYM